MVNNAPPERHSYLHDLAVRHISRVDLFGWAVPISNWERIAPYLVSHRRYQDALLEQQSMVFLNQDVLLQQRTQAQDIQRQFAHYLGVTRGRCDVLVRRMMKRTGSVALLRELCEF